MWAAGNDQEDDQINYTDAKHVGASLSYECLTAWLPVDVSKSIVLSSSSEPALLLSMLLAISMHTFYVVYLSTWQE